MLPESIQTSSTSEIRVSVSPVFGDWSFIASIYGRWRLSSVPSNSPHVKKYFVFPSTSRFSSCPYDLLYSYISSRDETTSFSLRSSLIHTGIGAHQKRVREMHQSGAASIPFLNLPSFRYSGNQLICSLACMSFSFWLCISINQLD